MGVRVSASVSVSASGGEWASMSVRKSGGGNGGLSEPVRAINLRGALRRRWRIRGSAA